MHRLSIQRICFLVVVLFTACLLTGCASGQRSPIVTGSVKLLPGQEAENIRIWVFWLDEGGDEQAKLFPVDEKLRFRIPLWGEGAYDLQAVVVGDEGFYTKPVRKIVQDAKLTHSEPIPFEFVEMTIYPADIE